MKRDPKSLWNADADRLLDALLGLRNRAEARRFIRDLMTEDEIRMVIERWRVARMLHEGAPYREIEAKTGASSRTIARISRWLQEGRGGYRALLERQPQTARRPGPAKS